MDDFVRLFLETDGHASNRAWLLSKINEGQSVEPLTVLELNLNVFDLDIDYARDVVTLQEVISPCREMAFSVQDFVTLVTEA